MPSYEFWSTLAGQKGQYNDLQKRVLQANGYTGSNADMYAQWRDEGFPGLTPIEDIE